MLKKIAIALIIFGVFRGFSALTMKTTVESSLGYEVNNIGLMEDRRIKLYLSGFMILIGVVLVGIGYSSAGDKIEGKQKKCPKCAESVKSEALICRFCNYEFPPEAKPQVAAAESAPEVAPKREPAPPSVIKICGSCKSYNKGSDESCTKCGATLAA